MQGTLATSHPSAALATHLAKHAVLAIQPLRLHSAQEELRTVGVGTGVGHGQNTGASVLKGEVLVSKLGAINGLTSGTVAVGEVTSLAHEVGDHTVERGSLETKTLFSGAKGAEVLSGLWNHIRAKLHDNSADGLTTGSHIEKALWQGHL